MNTSAPDDEPRAEHLDELALVGWSEGRLLEFERADVEAHLADCRACRALVAALEPERAPAQGPTQVRALPWRALLAAAAVVAFLVLLLLPERDPLELAPRLELALGDTRAGTFSDVRGAPLDGGELFVGVRLVDDGWVRLIAVDEGGLVHEVPLDPDGATSARFAGRSDHVFGPYPVELDGGVPIVAVLALASRERIEWDVVEATSWRGELGEQEVLLLGRALDATVGVQRVR